MSLELFAFAVIGIILVTSSLLVIKAREIVHSALFLALSFIMVAALFFILKAEFLAVVQLLIYAGAVVILMLFAIMLTKREKGISSSPNIKSTLFKGIAPLVFLVIILAIVATWRWYTIKGEVSGSPEAIGGQIFSYYIPHFEVVSLLLLAAMIGAIYLARRS